MLENTKPLLDEYKANLEKKLLDYSMEEAIREFLTYIGEDANREGLLETPSRFLKAWKFWSSGYKQDPSELFKTFEDGAEDCDQMVLVKDIPFYSHCEHHLTPFFGICHIAYIPNGRVIGLSKLARLVEIYARRLQVQERLTNQIANCIEENLIPVGVAVMIQAEHLCMSSRGVQKPGTKTITSALRGSFKTETACRAEFYSLVKA